MTPKQHILVTGASRGLGLSISNTLLSQGMNVIGLGRTSNRDIQKLESLYPQQFNFRSLDLSRKESLTREAIQKIIPPDIILTGLVNNAAIAYDDIVTNANLESLQEMFTVNVFAPVLFTKFAIRNMLLHRTVGSLVHISSVSVHTGYKGLSMYAGTKGAIEAFSKNVAREWGSKGIRSNCIVAGFMETDMSSSLDAELKHKIYSRTALKKPTSLTSIAETTRFLLGQESSSITGQNIFVDSGTI